MIEIIIRDIRCRHVKKYNIFYIYICSKYIYYNKQTVLSPIIFWTPHTGGPVAFSTAIITYRLLFVWCRKLFNLAVIDCITPMRSCRIRLRNRVLHWKSTKTGRIDPAIIDFQQTREITWPKKRGQE